MADVVFLDNLSGQRVILEVSVVTIGSDSSLAAGARAGLGGVRAQLQAREREKRNHGVIQKVLSDPGNNTIFTPDRPVCFWSHGTLDGGVPQKLLRAGAVGGQV